MTISIQPSNVCPLMSYMSPSFFDVPLATTAIPKNPDGRLLTVVGDIQWRDYYFLLFINHRLILEASPTYRGDLVLLLTGIHDHYKLTLQRDYDQ